VYRAANVLTKDEARWIAVNVEVMARASRAIRAVLTAPECGTVLADFRYYLA
jgi:hypothetical protein